MTLRKASVSLAVWIIYWTVPFVAHHSFLSTFDINKPIRLEGKVTQVNWGSPHVTVDIAVIDNSRKVVNWRVEFPSPNDMIRGGFNGSTISVGGEVVVGG